MKTEFTDTQEKIIAILDRAKEAGMVGHALQARVQVHGVSLSQEVRLLNEMMQEDIVIWTRVDRKGRPRNSGTEVLYLLAQYASEEQIVYYIKYREKLATTVSSRTNAETSNPVVVAAAPDVVAGMRSHKEAIVFSAIRDARKAHERGDMVAEAKALRKAYEVMAELEGM